MKGINVKKIAAFAGAFVLAGAAISAAEVVFGSTQLVDNNGQPTVKIYVGKDAAVSDGVAAANIAAKIANEAYKSSTLTASTSGTASCTVGSGVSGAGTCSLVEGSKKVTLEVEIPGTVAGTHTFKTLITDYIDRTLQNRNNTRSEDNYTATLSGTDTSGTITSPMRAVETDTLKGKQLYRIGSDKFTGFADYAMSDSQATAQSYTEEQSFWVGASATNPTVVYDSSSDIRDIVVNKYTAMAYSVKFSGNDFGIPVCTGDLSNNDTSNWASCSSDSNSRTDRHRVMLKFMGGDWIISEMTNPTGTLASSTAVLNGGQIKLAKEAKYGIINVGGELDAGAYKVRLADISVATGADNKHPAIIDILDSNGAVVGQIQVDPGTTYTFNNGADIVKIHVYKTAPGFTLNAKWAEMAIYTDEITLKDGSRYNLVSSTDTDKNFKVSLLWKNKDYTGGTDSNVSDSLREIVVYNIDGFDSKAKPGDVQNFLKSKPTFKLTYNGLDLTDDDYEPLTYNALSSDTYRIATSAGDNACGASSSVDYAYTAKLIEIKTGGSSLLGGTGDTLSGDYLFDKVLFDPIGIVGNGSTTLNGTQNQTYSGSYSPTVFYKVSGRDCWNYNVVAYGTGAAYVKFALAGDNTAAEGKIFFNQAETTLAGKIANIVLQEDAGYYGLTSNNAVKTYVPVLQNASTTFYSTFRFKAESSTTQQVYYMGLGATAATSYEPTLVTERGSKVLNVGTTDVSIHVAKMIGQPTFQFAFSDVTSASSANEYVLGVGDSKVFGGVTVKVKAIDANCGSCSVLGVGGAPGCAVDQTGVSAVIQPNNQPSVEVTEPYKLTSKLVMMESEATSAGVAILVGGPEVNMMTSDALKDSSVDFNTQPVVVKEIGNKIVVAGKTAADTMTAADEFIAGVKRQ